MKDAHLALLQCCAQAFCFAQEMLLLGLKALHDSKVRQLLELQRAVIRGVVSTEHCSGHLITNKLQRPRKLPACYPKLPQQLQAITRKGSMIGWGFVHPIVQGCMYV
jgi:hypothetical protein